LRYKDFHFAAKPAAAQRDADFTAEAVAATSPVGLEEVTSVKEFGEQMSARGVLGWWRESMGYGNRD